MDTHTGGKKEEAKIAVLPFFSLQHEVQVQKVIFHTLHYDL